MPTPAAPSGPPWSPMRVLLVADHPIVVAGVRLLLDTEPGITVVGTASTVAEALALAAHTQPDILLLDLDLGGEQGAACIPALLERIFPAHCGERPTISEGY